ncbi:hypothetical protein K431DRAFT_295566 [Polychaeton citri CBS 116435]|uniref:Uncharacterized protein n=1 Tax=Polychaeton citri CBS 116435 TaxID=1314669 RepID=A0A9P4Q807_9PEZI|nr:hypothetical protein K431DRAFT_295566 [Polychaeton citri CBS 116435]
MLPTPNPSGYGRRANVNDKPPQILSMAGRPRRIGPPLGVTPGSSTSDATPGGRDRDRRSSSRSRVEDLMALDGTSRLHESGGPPPSSLSRYRNELYREHRNDRDSDSSKPKESSRYRESGEATDDSKDKYDGRRASKSSCRFPNMRVTSVEVVEQAVAVPPAYSGAPLIVSRRRHLRIAEELV